MEELAADLVDPAQERQSESKKANRGEAELKQVTEEANKLSEQLTKMEKQGYAITMRGRQVDLKEKEADLKKSSGRSSRSPRSRSGPLAKRPRPGPSDRPELLTNLKKSKLRNHPDVEAVNS